MRARGIAASAAALAVAAGVSACGGDDGSNAKAKPTGGGTKVTIYSSQPLLGATRGQSLSVINRP